MKNWLSNNSDSKKCIESIIDSVHDAFIILSESFQILSANKTFYSIFNTTKEKIENHAFFKLEDIQWNSIGLKRLLEEVIHDNLVLENQEFDQQIYDVKKRLLISAKAICETDSRKLVLVQIEDITSRHEAEIGEKKAVGKYEKIVEDIGHIIFSIDNKGRVTFVNKFAESVFGYNRLELIGKPLVGTLIALVESTGQQNANLWQNMLQNPDRLYAGKSEGICKDGRRICFSWSARTFSNNGDITEVVFDGNDTTDIEKTRYELQQKKLLFDTILDLVPEGIIVTDQNKIIQAASRYTGKILCRSLDTIIKSNESKIIGELPIYWSDGQNKPSSDEFPLSQRSIEKKVPTGYDLIYKQDGHSKTLTYIAVPVCDSKGNVIGSVGNFRDTTESTSETQKRKQVEELLARNEALLSNMSNGVMIHEPDGKISYMNPVAKALYDISDISEKKISFTLMDFQRKEIPLSEWPYSRALRGERFEGYEVLVVNNHSGREWYASYNGSPVYSNRGKLLYAVISVLDISKRKKAEMQLQTSQLKLQKIIDSDTLGIVVSDAHGHLVEANDYFLRLIGYTRDEFEKIKVKWSEITPPESTKLDKEAGRLLKEKGQCPPYEKQYYRKDGSLIWALVGAIAYPDNQYIAFIIEITEKKTIENALRKSEAHLQIVFNTVAEGIIICDSSGNILQMNKAQLDISEFKYGENYEKNNQEFVKKYQLQYLNGMTVAFEEWPLQKILNGESLRDLELRLLRKDTGEDKYYEFSGEPVRDESGNINFAVMVTKDITARKKTEESLRKSESQLRAVFDTVAEGILIFDTTGKVVLANKYEAEMFGFKSAEEVMKSLDQFALEYEIFDLDGNPILVEQWPIARVLRGETIKDLELIGRSKNEKSKRYIGVNAEPVFDNEGKQVLSVVITRDITARKEAEKKVKESEERFRGIFELSPIGVASLDTETGRYFLANEQLAKITGYSREELLKMSFRDITHPEDREKDWDKFQKMANGKIEEYDNEKRYISKDGRIIWVRVTAKRMHDKPMRTIGAIQDITRRKEAEIKLAKSEELFRNLADNITQLAWMADPEGKIFWYNKRWYEFTGTKLEDVKGWGWKKVLHPEYVDRVVRKIQHSWDTGEPWEDTFPLKGKDGSYRWFLSRALPIRNEKGALVRWFGTNTDITEAREREARIEEQKRALEAILETIPQGLAVAVPPEGKIIYASRYDRAHTGNPTDYTEEELVRIRKMRLRKPGEKEAAPYLETPIYRALKGEKVTNEEWEMDSIQGKTLLTMASAEPIRDKKNNIEGAVIAWSDISERKQTEEENAFQAARYQAVFNSITEGLMIIDKSSTIIEVNPATYKTFQMIADLKNKKIIDLADSMRLYDDKDREIPVQMWPASRITRGEKIENLQICIHFKNGIIRYVLTSGSPVLINNEASISVLIFRDITKQIETERELRSALNKLQRFVNANIIGIEIGNLKGELTDANDYFLKLSGYTREELKQGKIDWKALSPAEYHHKDEIAINELKIRGVCNPYEKEMFKKDGSRAWISLAAAMFTANEFVAFIQEITDRKKLEKQLNDERNFISAILSTQSAIVVLFDTHGKITYANRALERLTGYKLIEIKGIPFWKFFPEKDYKFDFNKYELVKPDKPVIIDRWIKSKTGEMYFIRWRNVVLRNDNGEITDIVATGIDITDRLESENRIKKLNDELRKHTSELEIINSELESFSYSVSHDLKAPLNVISGFSQYIIEQYNSRLDSELMSYLSKILIGTKKMDSLINDLLTLSQISRSEMVTENIDLSEIVSSYLKDLQATEPERNTNFTIQKGIVVKADRRLLHLAIENLLNNSWKYCSKNEKTEIEFGSIVKNGEVVYFIKDNGVGFNMAYVSKIFQPFKRLHSEREFKGTGIGLATVGRVLRRHNGRIWAEAEVNKGATFYFTLGID